MRLADIYKRPVDRRINPAVVAQDNKESTVKTEIEEYVFTDEIINNLYKVLVAIKDKEKVSKTGIWINGYYGSGKSHFLKFVHYCIASETREKAFDRLIEAVKERDIFKHPHSKITMTISEATTLKTWYDNAEIEDVLFNAQDVSKADRDSNTFTHIFFNMFNQCRGYNAYNIPIAILLEKYLDNNNVFTAFKEKLETEEGFCWETDAADVVTNELDTVLRIAKERAPSLDIDALKITLLNPETYHIDTRKFTQEVQKYIAEKGDNYRLLFLVDEVSQFVNTNKKVLLDLQSVVERLSDNCNHQVWVACTAQQTIETVVEGTGINSTNDEYGKIMGRFETRVSLESTDPAYITQKRILEKNSEGEEALHSLYSEEKDAILNQFSMSHELYKGFQNEKEFELSYPFVPYQFKLISQVFDAFQKLEYVVTEVKDNERSVLKITHETAKLTKDWEVGRFIPFDEFFNQMFWQNLIHKGTRAINPALELAFVKSDDFAQRVVKVLFMVSNLLDKDKQNFGSTIGNITLLMMTNVDENKLKLRNRIEDVLNKLVENNIIREEKGNYYFYNEDEAELSTLIKNTLPGSDFRADMLNKILFPFLKVDNKIRFSGNDFRIIANIDGKNYLGNNGDIQITFSAYDDTETITRSLNNPTSSLVFCINDWLMHNKELQNNFNWYCKVEKYLLESSEVPTAAREKSREKFRSRNATLLKGKIEPQIQKLFEETRFISGQSIIEPNEVTGKGADRYRNVLTRHLENVYKYAKLTEGMPVTAEELRQKANRTVSPDEYGELHPMTDAEKMVNDYITRMGNEMTLSELIRKFTEAPYGWKDVTIIYIVTELCKRKLREPNYKKQPRYPIKDFVAKALISSERSSLAITSAQEISQEAINMAIKAWQQIFNVYIPFTGDGNALFDELKDKKIPEQRNTWQKIKESCEGYPFIKPLRELTDIFAQWLDIREPKRLFETLHNCCQEMAVLMDRCRNLQEFVKDQLDDYNKMRIFCNNNQENFHHLGVSDQEKAGKLDVFFKSEWPVDDFRICKIMHGELKTAIDDTVKALQKDAFQKYNSIFDELATLAQENSVSPAVYANREYKLNDLKKQQSIVSLQLALSDADHYLSGERAKVLMDTDRQRQENERQELLKQKPGKDEAEVPPTPLVAAEPPVKYELPKANKILSSESDIDDYLKDIRRELIKLITDNKKIIIK